MARVPNTIKDISRAVADLNDANEGGYDLRETFDRVVNNLAYTLGKEVNLHHVTTREIAMVLASHGYKGDLNQAGRIVAKGIRAAAYEHGRLSVQL